MWHGIAVLALITRENAQDVLCLYLPPFTSPFQKSTLQGMDVQTISWSPCGRWLVMLDATPSGFTGSVVHVYTPDGFRYRSVRADDSLDNPGYRSLAWSPSTLAIAPSDTVSLLNRRTFSPLASFALDTQAESGWAENVSVRGEHSYSFLTDPDGFTTSRQQTKINSAPAATSRELQFDASGHFFAVLDPSMPAAISVYDVSSIGASNTAVRRIVLQQHASVKRLIWHPTRPRLLMFLGDDGVAYLWDAGTNRAPIVVARPFSGEGARTDVRWISPKAGEASHEGPDLLAILITARKKGWVVSWPEGRPELPPTDEATELERDADEQQSDGGDVTEDSLYEVLTGRTPSPQKRNPRDTALSGSMESPLEGSVRLDDTFKDKSAPVEREGKDFDDDSEIF